MRKLRKLTTKVKQSVLDKLSEDKNVFGKITKGIDFGRLSDKEYDKLTATLPTHAFSI